MNITIDEKEYDASNLTEEQQKVLATIKQADGAQGLLSFLFTCVGAVKDHNVQVLKNELKEVEEVDDE
jgi:hypothetical protein